MSLIPANQLTITTAPNVKLHLDRAEMRAANWMTLEGWVTHVQRGDLTAQSNWPLVHCCIKERPDVCAAFALEPEIAFGFELHLLTPEANGVTKAEAQVQLFVGECLDPFASIEAPVHNTGAAALPFASAKALALTKSLYRDPITGQGLDAGGAASVLEGGVVCTTPNPLPFENTRIGNYHPDILDLLNRPGAIGLDIGCGLRDVVYDNLVTQDIYRSPTATLITAPGDLKLPFGDQTFDLIVIDSVLEHVPDPVALLAEGLRLLKPGGQIFGDVPFLQPLHLAPHHYFNFTPYGVKVAAEKAGLELVYVQAEAHQRPEFSLEWLLRRTFETIGAAQTERLKRMTVAELYECLVRDKALIPFPAEALTEMAAGYRFHMKRPKGTQ
jgi:SAM-dependent methyltransferase